MNYVELNQQELDDRPKPTLILTPYNVQNVILELIQNHFLMNDPAKMGYVFEQRYDRDREKSDILIENNFNWKANVAAKRPSVFIGRGDAQLKYPTMQQGVGGGRVQDSQRGHIALIELPFTISVVASPVGFCENLADYVKAPFLYYAQQIQKDFCIERLRLVSIGKPQLINIAQKDEFVIELEIVVNFTDRWMITGDHLKLKSVTYAIFDKLTQSPLN